MLRFLLSLPLSIGLTLAISGTTLSAPQEDVEQMQKAVVELENNPSISAEQKAKMKEQMQKEMAKRGGKPPEQQPDANKDDKKDGEKKDGKDEEKKDEGKTVTRPDKPKKEPDPKELEAQPTNGKLILNFHGHPWPAMIEWYSRVTDREITWQELPKGYVNLRTQNPMSMERTGDMLNRLLLGLGFTMLDDGDFLQIVKTDGVNPAFVPRVDPRKLATLMPHSFVRTSFLLQRFKAEDIVKELETMKSEHGKLSAMTAANRIEAMDMVRNLQDIYMALDQEQNSGHHKPREFIVKFVRAELIKGKLEEMLGVAQSKAPMTPQQMQQMQQMEQMRQQQRQQQQQQNGGQPPNAQAKEEKISIIVNEMKNSIIVKSPPHRMLDIADAIELLDVSPSSNALDIKAYTLATRSPQEVADMLKESGALSPTSVVRVDKDSKALLVSGNDFDQFQVQQLIKTIDGNARRFVSIRLRRYPAAQVAATIEKMMGQPKEEKNNRRPYYYSWYDRDNQEEKNPNDKFQVTADVENNRLILKCNDAEYDMVMELLTQMGEIMTRSPFVENQVVLEDVAGDDQDELLRKVKAAFQAYAPNEVILPPPQEKQDPPKEEKDESEDESAVDAVDITMLERHRHETMYTQLEIADATSPAKAASQRDGNGSGGSPPPVVIERNAQGKIVIRSKDPKALEMFEELMRQMAPKNQDWVSFRMKNVSALWMRLQLEDFFEEDEDDGNSNFRMWYWGFDQGSDEKAPAGLGEERKMRFIDDSDRTLVVRNASPKQLATVRELIKLYDTAEPPNENQARYKRIIPIKFSKARVIETALKDAFRDLLSSNDKAFEQKNQGEGEKGESRRFYGYNPFYGEDDEDSGLGASTFKGHLSFGVDESTNTLIVTAKGKNLLEIVADMVDQLDQAAVPTDDSRVVSMPPGLNSAAVRDALMKMFGPEAIAQKPNNGEQPPEGEQQPGQPDQNGRPGGERRGGEGNR